MMAISALSLAHRTGTQSADALDHYQQVLPAMRLTIKSEEDAISDGALFTHYLLLLYEVSASSFHHLTICAKTLITLNFSNQR